LAWTLRIKRRRTLAAGVVAALIAALSIVALESTGTVLKDAYTGLGGQLTTSRARPAANIVPAAAAPY